MAGGLVESIFHPVISVSDMDASIASLRGRLHRYRDVPLIVTYHPAYLLRTLLDKAKAWEDLLLARRTMARLVAEAAAVRPVGR